MAGSSSKPGGSSRKRPGAVPKRTKSGTRVGSGGQRRRGLQGKGPTPRAEDRPNHKAYRPAKPGRSSRKKPIEDAEWVAGRNAVLELVRESVPVTAIYVAEGLVRDSRVREVFKAAAERGIGVLEASAGELDRHTGGAVHQGIAARVPVYEYAEPSSLLERAAERGEPPLVVMLDGVTDPRNLGAVVRSAAGFGAHGVVVPERRAAGMTAAAWKSSAGAAARVPVARTVNLTRQLKAYQQDGLMVAGLDARGGTPLPGLAVADGPLVLVVGSEGKGLSRLVAETCDVRVSIPMASGLESLNAGVAAGIALYAVAQCRA